jgi:hypothetical protein
LSYSCSYSYYNKNNNNDNYTESLLSAATRSFKYTTAAQASSPNSPFPLKLGSDDKGDLYIRSFLINSRPNARGWQVDPGTVRSNVLSIIGKPLCLDKHPISGRIDHPLWLSSRSASDNYEAQRSKAVGIVEKVFYDAETDSYYADSKITDPSARNYIDSFSGKVPIAVSPQLIYDPAKEKPNYYKDWSFSHLAIVDKAAYGAQARVIGACNGDAQTCHQKLQTVASTAAAAAASASFASSADASSIVTRYASYASGLLKTPYINGKPPRRLA